MDSVYAPTLPYDLQLETIQIFLANLDGAQERVRALKVLAFISSPMRDFCQKRLFRQFTVGRPDCYACYLVLRNNTRLASYVKELGFRFESSRFRHGQRHMAAADLEIIRMLTSIQHLYVETTRDPVYWTEFSYCTRRTIIDLLLNRSITSFYSHGMATISFTLLPLLGNLDSLEMLDGNPGTGIDIDADLPSDFEEAFEEYGNVDDFELLKLFDEFPTNCDEEAFAVIRLKNLCLIDIDTLLIRILIHPEKAEDLFRQTNWIRRPWYSGNVELKRTVMDPNADQNDGSSDESDAEGEFSDSRESDDNDSYTGDNEDLSDSSGGSDEIEEEMEETTLEATLASESDSSENDGVPQPQRPYKPRKPDVFCKRYTPIFPDHSAHVPDQYLFEFSRLQNLTVDIQPANTLPVWHIIWKAAASLIKLDIRERIQLYSWRDAFGIHRRGFPANYDPECILDLPPKITLAPCTKLEELSISINFIHATPVKPDIIASWCTLLRTAPPGIRVLEITINLFSCFRSSFLGKFFRLPEDVDADGILLPTMFSVLDEVISDSVLFPSLELVRINVDLPETYDNREPLDVVDEEDLLIMQSWNEKMASVRAHPHYAGNINQTAMTDANDSSLDGQDEEIYDRHTPGSPSGSFTSEPPIFSSDSNQSMVDLLPTEHIEASIDYMFTLTREKFSSLEAFMVNIITGLHCRPYKRQT